MKEDNKKEILVNAQLTSKVIAFDEVVKKMKWIIQVMIINFMLVSIFFRDEVERVAFFNDKPRAEWFVYNRLRNLKGVSLCIPFVGVHKSDRQLTIV